MKFCAPPSTSALLQGTEVLFSSWGTAKTVDYGFGFTQYTQAKYDGTETLPLVFDSE
jgi:hypothetical protein